MEANEPGFILLIVKILIAKISYPFIQAVCAAWMNAYGYSTLGGMGVFADVIPEGAQEAIRRMMERSKNVKIKLPL